MTYLVIRAKTLEYFIPMIDSIGKRGIHYLWNTENLLILIEGAENIAKVKSIWDVIENGVKIYEEGIYKEES